MLERSRLPQDSAHSMVLWGDSLIDYAASSNQRLQPPVDILDRGLGLSLVDFLGEHPQLFKDLAPKGALRQGDITCCSPSGRRIWAPQCIEDSRVSVVTDPPQGPTSLRSW